MTIEHIQLIAKFLDRADLKGFKEHDEFLQIRQVLDQEARILQEKAQADATPPVNPENSN